MLVVEVVEKPALTGDIAIAITTKAAIRAQRFAIWAMMRSEFGGGEGSQRRGLLVEGATIKNTEIHTYTHTHTQMIEYPVEPKSGEQVDL